MNNSEGFPSFLQKDPRRTRKMREEIKNKKEGAQIGRETKYVRLPCEIEYINSAAYKKQKIYGERNAIDIIRIRILEFGETNRTLLKYDIPSVSRRAG